MTAELLALMLGLGLQGGGAAAAIRADVVLVAEGGFYIDLHVDLDGLLLGSGPGSNFATRLEAMERFRELDSMMEEAAVERLQKLLRRRVRARFDGRAAPFSVSFPQRRNIEKGLLTLGRTVRLSGAVPDGAARFQFFASRSFRDVDLRVHTGREELRFLLLPGEESPELKLQGHAPGTGASSTSP